MSIEIQEEENEEEVVDLHPDEIEVKSFNEIIKQENPIRLSDITTNLGAVNVYSANGITVYSGADILLREGGDIKFTSVTAPVACVATLIATDTGNVDAGTHKYKVTYVNDTGETELGAISNTITADGTHKQVALSNIPVSTSISVTSRKIYRTKAGADYYYLLTTISENTTTTYTDNTSDASLGTANATNRPNNSFGKIIIDDIICGSFSSSNVSLGNRALNALDTGHFNVAIGYHSQQLNEDGYQNVSIGYGTLINNVSGSNNIAIGYHALKLYTGTTAGNIALGLETLGATTSGWGNVAVGNNALYTNETGDKNVAIGGNSLQNSTGDNNIAVGYGAGYYETGSSKLFIDNAQRTNEADGRVKALIYGVMAAATANQKLTINGLLRLSESKTPASSGATGAAGDIAWDASYIYVCTATDTWKRVAIETW